MTFNTFSLHCVIDHMAIDRQAVADGKRIFWMEHVFTQEDGSTFTLLAFEPPEGGPHGGETPEASDTY